MFNFLRRKVRLYLSVGLCVSLPFASLAQQSIKADATAAKVTPDLLRAVATYQAAQARPGIRTSATTTTNEQEVQLQAVDVTDVVDGRIAIEAIAEETGAQNLLTDLQTLGLTGGIQYERIIFGYLPIDKVASLKDVAGLRFARVSFKPVHNAGVVNSQGDRAMRSDVARQTYSVTGAGSKVGVLSDSYNAKDRASGGVDTDDLPRGIQVIDDDLRAGNEDEGRAMAEIIHDVAPGAAIAFNTANRGQSGMANGILNLARAGCNIIVDDVIYYLEPFFQDGIVAQAVNQAVKNYGVSYFSSAGNNARSSFSTAFVNSGKPAPGLKLSDGVAHAFPDGSLLQSVTLAAGGGQFFGIYQWDDPFYSVSGKPGAATDMDVYVYFNGQILSSFSSAYNNLGSDPYEAISIQNTGTAAAVIQIAMVRYAGPSPSIIKFVNFGSGSRVQFQNNSSTTYGHANAEGAIAVGAAYYGNTQAFNPRLSAPVIERFSSAGGTPILFSTTGQRIQTVVRQKPEITAPDGASTSFFFRLTGDTDGDGYPNFFGTSAAAPHAAAVAALMQQRSGNVLSGANILANLTRSAIDMDDPSTPGFDTGFDYGTGYGLIQADRALAFTNTLRLLTPLYNCQTNTITFRSAGGDGSLIEYRTPGVTDWTTGTTFTLDPGIVRDGNTTTLDVQARQNGIVVTMPFNFRQACVSTPASILPGTAFTLLAPVFNCQNGQFLLRTTAGNGTRIEYRVPGVSDWTTNPLMVLEPGPFNDKNTTSLQLQARQSGVFIVYDFNFRQYCATGQTNSVPNTATSELITPSEDVAPELEVTVLGNPSTGNWANVQILGAQNQPLTLKVAGMRGEWISEQQFETAQPNNRYQVPLGQTTGLYLLQVNTPTQTKLVKILRQ